MVLLVSCCKLEAAPGHFSVFIVAVTQLNEGITDISFSLSVCFIYLSTLEQLVGYNYKKNLFLQDTV